MRIVAAVDTFLIFPFKEYDGNMENEEIAETLDMISEILEEQEDDLYRIKAYRRAAHFIKSYPKNIEDLVNTKFDLTLLPHIGKRLSELIKNIILDGNEFTLKKFSKLPINRPKIFKKRKGKLRSFKIYNAIFIIDKLLLRLNTISYIKKIECSGDFRRKKEIIDNVYILIITKNIANTFKQFLKFPSIKYILQKKSNFLTVQLKAGIQVTVCSVNENNFGAKLLKTTGSDSHLAEIQKITSKKNLKLTNQGLYYRKKKIAGNSEVDIYNKLSLSYIPPELRENRGEINAAMQNTLPKLIELNEIKGDLHCHTHETDGSFSLEEMVEAAIQQGYEYIAITDHSKNLKITHGMDEKRLIQQIKMIDKLNEKFNNIQILKSIEVDILENGDLDLSNNVLKELDLTVCSIHSKFSLSKEKQTERIIRAMDNPYFNILGHATGRILNHRLGYQIDIDEVLAAAKSRNCFIEVNAQPARLDINDIYCKKAKDAGVKVAISSDAHTLKGFSFMILGINQARRGWLEAIDVINTYKLPQLRKLLKKK